MKFCKVHMKMNHQDSNKRMYISQGILKHYMKAEYQITYFSSPYSVQNNMLPIAILMFLIMKNGIEMFRTAGDGHTCLQPQHLADRGRRMKGQGHSGLRNVWLGGRSRSPGSHIKYRARKIKPQGGGSIALWHSPCSACMKSWVCSPPSPKEATSVLIGGTVQR